MCLLCWAALMPSRAPLSLIAFARQIEASHTPGGDNGAHQRDVQPRLSARSAQDYPLALLLCNDPPPVDDGVPPDVISRQGDGSRQYGGDFGPGSSNRQARPPPDGYDDSQRSFFYHQSSNSRQSSNSGTRASPGGPPNPQGNYYYSRNTPNAAEGDNSGGRGGYRAHTSGYGDCNQQTAFPDYRQPQDSMAGPQQTAFPDYRQPQDSRAGPQQTDAFPDYRQPQDSIAGPVAVQDLPGRRCECGQGQPTLALPNRPMEPRWCARCPSRPLGTVPTSSPAVASSSNERTRAPKRCRCGQSAHPKHGLNGEPPQLARWCSQCPSRPINAVDIVSKRCECGRGLPNFGVMVDGTDSRKVARYWCANCPNRPPEARDMSKKCECRRSKPSFGLPGEEKKAARWCSRCPTKPPEAVDVVNKRCECGQSLPSFGLPGEGRKNARWCSRCPDKPPNAVNVINKRCVCGTSKPSLGLPGEPAKFARWCSQCPTKPSNAIDVINKRCECGVRRPGFGLPGEPKKDARWCKTCPSKPAIAISIMAVNSSQQNK